MPFVLVVKFDESATGEFYSFGGKIEYLAQGHDVVLTAPVMSGLVVEWLLLYSKAGAVVELVKG